MQNPADTPDESTGWPRRHVLKAGALAVGAGLLGRFANAASGTAIAPAEYLAMDASDMARAVQKGELSPENLLAAAMARCDAVNPKVNAVNMRHDDYANALLKARTASGASTTGALAGVPILIKDLNTYLEGTRTTNGCRLYKDAPLAPHTSTLITRYQAAGAVPFGKTTCPEFGLTTTTESLLWGQTRNPWNLAKSAGGSSGGAASAVAAGIVPVAHATDGGGSIRIPASYCGLVGLKPTRYRTPSGPGKYEGWFGASVGNVVSRNVRDMALFMDAGQGHEAGSPYWAKPLERPYVEELRTAPGRLRIGVVRDSLTGAPLDPEVERVLSDTAKRLAAQGHEVEELRLGIDPRAQPLLASAEFDLSPAPFQISGICSQLGHFAAAGRHKHRQRPDHGQQSSTRCTADNGTLPTQPADGIPQDFFGLMGAPDSPLDRIQGGNYHRPVSHWPPC